MKARSSRRGIEVGRFFEEDAQGSVADAGTFSQENFFAIDAWPAPLLGPTRWTQIALSARARTIVCRSATGGNRLRLKMYRPSRQSVRASNP